MKNQTALKTLGFSLIELLVVLVIMGLVASLSFPRIQNTLLAYERSSMQEKLTVFLRQQMSKASTLGTQLVIPAGTKFTLDENPSTDLLTMNLLNDNFQPELTYFYQTKLPLKVNNNGMCASTTISLVFDNAQRDLSLTQPFCHVTGKDG